MFCDRVPTSGRNHLLGREIGIRGLTIGRRLVGVVPERRAGLSAESDVAGTYPLDQIKDAIQRLSRPGKNGTVIVKI